MLQNILKEFWSLTRYLVERRWKKKVKLYI